jgi:hypothetical protein
MTGPPLQNVDWALSKEFKFRSPLNKEATALQFRWENYNIFNWTNLGLPDSTIDSGSAGQITGLSGNGPYAAFMRRMQFSIKLTW